MAFSQNDRNLKIATPLGADAVLLVGFRGEEAISRPFAFELDVVADPTKVVAFDKLLGQNVTVSIVTATAGVERYFNGIISRMSAGDRSEQLATYRLELVPFVWRLSRVAQSRIFQQMNVPDILKKVLEGVEVVWEIQGTFQPRDYCVQYRETDLDFAARLMEEEGIFYFFRHENGAHKMVVANTSQTFSDLPSPATLIYDEVKGGQREDDRVTGWRKIQELRSGKVTSWDHCFELPGKNLEATKPTLETVTVGTVAHKLKVGGNDALEVYDYPGGYAQRFDGISPTGGEQASELQKIFEDATRTTEIRMQEEEARTIRIEGTSDVRHLVPGCKMKLDRHPNANGEYVVRSVKLDTKQPAPEASGDQPAFEYGNDFTCFPSGLPFRPPRVTTRPVVHGTQTAVVVGPSGQDIFTDKYGRVKVQFNWDREGKKDASSSCWIRVGTPWAGALWGMVHIPRIGQEVVVDFLEGDPDQPLIVGGVYNAEQMPPWTLPANMTRSGVKTKSTPKSGSGRTDGYESEKGFNELRFEDKKGAEDIYFHAEKDFHRIVENDDDLKVFHDQKIEVKNARTEVVKEGDEKVTIEKGTRTVTISKGADILDIKEGDHTISVGMQTTTFQSDVKFTIEEGKREVLIKTGNDSLSVDTGNRTTTVKTGNDTTKVSAGKSSTEAAQSIELKVGGNSITIDQSGITIKGIKVTVEGQAQAEVKAAIVQVQGSGMVKVQGGVVMIN